MALVIMGQAIMDPIIALVIITLAIMDQGMDQIIARVQPPGQVFPTRGARTLLNVDAFRIDADPEAIPSDECVDLFSQFSISVGNGISFVMTV